MPYTITINDNSPAAMNFVKFAKSLDFTTVTKTKEAKKTATIAEKLDVYRFVNLISRKEHTTKETT